LAGRLQGLRKAAGLTQQQLATAAGLSMSLITQLEQGVKDDPKMSTLLALAGVLGATVNDLAGQSQPSPPVAPPAGRRRGRRKT
jgi:transcriptional regulator with XRE-family HTH domain